MNGRTNGRRLPLGPRRLRGSLRRRASVPVARDVGPEANNDAGTVPWNAPSGDGSFSSYRSSVSRRRGPRRSRSGSRSGRTPAPEGPPPSETPSESPSPRPAAGNGMPPPPERCNGRLHQIRAGDTLQTVAEAADLSLEAVLAANPQITEPERLIVGQVVCVPRRTEDMAEMFNTLLAAESIEVALYSRALNSPALRGLPSDQYAYFQAALSHEAAHVRALRELGASVPYTEFYFPPGTFEERDVFLHTILMIETAGVAAYTQTSIELGRMGRFDLARLAGRIMGVEAEHRTLIRSVLGLVPANNLCFEEAPDKPVAAILDAVPKFLSPNQFDGESEGPVALPSSQTVKELVGPNGCPNPTP